MQDKAFEVLKSLPSMDIQPTVEVSAVTSTYTYIIHTYIYTIHEIVSLKYLERVDTSTVSRIEWNSIAHTCIHTCIHIRNTCIHIYIHTYVHTYM